MLKNIKIQNILYLDRTRDHRNHTGKKQQQISFDATSYFTNK